ncbi:MAG: hypothetical protein BWX47_01959 [candidate division Hyd24-12 bacterium ADurb.Bin004]|nr:MAG: hypothetical protein BWX47_01959 [candidate division Hyd24-12 bacterium ADurb.Bin004]
MKLARRNDWRASAAYLEIPAMSRLKTACSATEEWPNPKTIRSFDLLAEASSPAASRLSSHTGLGSRLILA